MNDHEHLLPFEESYDPPDPRQVDEIAGLLERNIYRLPAVREDAEEYFQQWKMLSPKKKRVMKAQTIS